MGWKNAPSNIDGVRRRGKTSYLLGKGLHVYRGWVAILKSGGGEHRGKGKVGGGRVAR